MTNYLILQKQWGDFERSRLASEPVCLITVYTELSPLVYLPSKPSKIHCDIIIGNGSLGKALILETVRENTDTFQQFKQLCNKRLQSSSEWEISDF